MAVRRVCVLIVLLGLVFLLAACGEAQARQPSAEEVHRQWIAALRANDRQAAQQFLAPDLRSSVDRALSDMQTELRSPVLGELQSVDIQPPTAQGAGQVGWSIWTFAKRTECFAADLAQVESAWYITNWGRRACEER